MSVLIKGMEIPISCASCNLIQEIENEWFCPFSAEPINYWVELQKKSEYCPLVEVPTPHGDLIDRDRLLRGEGRYVIALGKDGIDVSEIERAPTVIEAEGE